MMKENKERFDLEAITRNITENYKPAMVQLTSYEQEQEDNAIISYEELVNKMENNHINYDTSYVHHDDEVSVKKIDLDNEYSEPDNKVSNETSGLKLTDYEKEEEFLRSLRQLQSNLAR